MTEITERTIFHLPTTRLKGDIMKLRIIQLSDPNVIERVI